MSIERKDVAPSVAYPSTALAIHHARYLLARDLVTGKRVLDIACGEGLGAAQMAAHFGAVHVMGVDNSEPSIENARQTFSHVPNLTFLAQDAYQFLEETDEQFDVIVSIETIEHVDDPQRLLDLFKQRLAPAGAVLLTCPNDAFYYGSGPSLNEHHKSVFSLGEFRELTEGVFGQGSWFLGTKLAGFAGLPLSFEGRQARYGERLPTTEEGGIACHMVPVGAREEGLLSPEGSVFFAGVFGNFERVGPSLGVICAGSHFRQNVPGVFNNIQKSEATQELEVCLVCDNSNTATRLKGVVDASDLHRLHITILDLSSQQSAEGIAPQQDKGGAQPRLLHFVTASAFSSYVESMSRPSDQPSNTRLVSRLARRSSNQIWTLGLTQTDADLLGSIETTLLDAICCSPEAANEPSVRAPIISNEGILFGCPPNGEDEHVSMQLSEREILRILVIGQNRAMRTGHSRRLRGLETLAAIERQLSLENELRTKLEAEATAFRSSILGQLYYWLLHVKERHSERKNAAGQS